MIINNSNDAVKNVMYRQLLFKEICNYSVDKYNKIFQ